MCSAHVADAAPGRDVTSSGTSRHDHVEYGAEGGRVSVGPCPSGPAVTANTWHSSIHRCRPPARCCTSPGDGPPLRKGIQLGWGAPGSVLLLDIGGGTSVGRRGLCGKRCVSHVSLGPACLVVQALAGVNRTRGANKQYNSNARGQQLATSCARMALYCGFRVG